MKLIDKMIPVAIEKREKVNLVVIGGHSSLVLTTTQYMQQIQNDAILIHDEQIAIDVSTIDE